MRNLFETFVVAELMKSYLNRGEQPTFYFWRDSNGVEVDILIEQGEKIIPIEIKSGKTYVQEFLSGIEKWTALAGNITNDPVIIYGGKDNFRHKGIRVIGWKQLSNRNLFG